MRRNKYNNKRVERDGHKFDSQRELVRYLELNDLQKAGKIRDLKLQPRYLLQDKFTYNGRTVRKIEYVADFEYTALPEGVVIVEDVKGVQTEVFKLKMKMFLKRWGHLVRFKIVK